MLTRVIAGNVAAGKTTLIGSLTEQLPNANICLENHTNINEFKKFLTVKKQNKLTGEAYNKHSLSALLEHLDNNYDNEISSNNTRADIVILERSIYEHEYVFARHHLIKGNLNRLYD